MSIEYNLVNRDRKVFLDLGRFYEQDIALNTDLIPQVISDTTEDDDRRNISVQNLIKKTAFIKRYPGHIEIMNDDSFHDLRCEISGTWYEFLKWGPGPWEREVTEI